MCGISGTIAKKKSDRYWNLLIVSQIRGQDGTGVADLRGDMMGVTRSPLKASDSMRFEAPHSVEFEIEPKDMVIGQNRLAIFGLGHENDQPLVGERFALVHNGNLTHFEEKFKEWNLPRTMKVDSELILRYLEMCDPQNITELFQCIRQSFDSIEGNFACIVLDKKLGVTAAFNRYKTLFYTDTEEGIFFFSTARIGAKIWSKGEKFVELKNNGVVIFSSEGELLIRD